MKNQQEIGYQGDMFIEHKLNAIGQWQTGEGVSQASRKLAGQTKSARKQGRALAGDLIGKVCSMDNIRKAYKQVKRNKGVPGIDQMPVESFSKWFSKHGENLEEQLLLGEYLPHGVKEVVIPKADGGSRRLGIPTVTDRIIQQAVTQVLTPIYEREFSDQSYGYRPRRSAHQALKQASEYVSEGRRIVVDMDLKSFFDEVCHDRLMSKLSKKIKDKSLLLLIRRYLQSGIMIEGLVSQRQKGTPQGSPLSPLLSNIVLDELDKELEKRGHRFVRYADDFSIFVRSQKAGERVKESITEYLTNKLKLKVNEEKSVVCECYNTNLLGYRIDHEGLLRIAPSREKRLKAKLRGLTKRKRGVSLSQLVEEVNPILRGWLNYYKHAENKSLFRNLDSWLRRRLRCFRLKQCKRVIGVYRFLKSCGVKQYQSWLLALSGKGWWRKSGCPQAHQAMGLEWFRKLGLYEMSIEYQRFKDLT